VDVPGREALGLGEEQEHFHSRKAMKILGWPCLQPGTEVGLNDSDSQGFPSATFTKRHYRLLLFQIMVFR